MKSTLRQFLASLTLIAALVGGLIATATDAPKPAAPAPTALETASKERDDAKAQVAALQAQQQQQAVVTEYYKAVAEKNQAILQAVGLQQQVEALTKERDKLKSDLDYANSELEALRKVKARLAEAEGKK
jgi:predicted  nucleic acid-binding Zn-ribbon protein